MKKILSFIAVAALMLGITSCEVFPEDAFSTAPVAPELYSHSDILMTSNTMDEDINFSWSAYRFLPEGLNYDFYAEYEGTAAKLASTKTLYYIASKSDFKTILYNTFSSLPENNTFTMSFFVQVTDGANTYKSETITIDIYAFGDAVAPVFSEVIKSVTLDPADPTGEVMLFTWEPARLGYNEEITYSVFAQFEDGDAIELASDLKTTSYTVTVDSFNDAIVSTGAPEAQTSDVKFFVKAFSETYASGVPSAVITIPVKTYIASYPDILYLPGSHQGWNPATAPMMYESTVAKGFYEGVIDLRTEDGSDVEFKFCIKPEWGDDFGGIVEVSTFAGEYASAKGAVGAPDNIKVPSGIYNIALNKKLNTIYMVELGSLGVIGTAVGGWDADIDLVYDAEKQTFSAPVDIVPGEFKFRFNDDWTHSMGGHSLSNVSTTIGNNLNYEGPEGNFKIVLNVSKTPYTVTFINTAYPDNLYIPGNHQGWNPGTAPMLTGDGNGHYEGFAHLDGEFKFTHERNWDNDFGGTFDALVLKGSNLNLEKGYYYLSVDLTELKATALLITRVAVVGSFCGWGSPEDAAMAYDAGSDSWKITGLVFPANTEYKFRMNAGWDLPDAYNLGGEASNLVYGGANLKDPEGGTYDIELILSSKPFKAIITRTGDAPAPAYAPFITVPGSYSGHSWNPTDDVALYQGGAEGLYKGAIAMYGGSNQFKFHEAGAGWISGQLKAGTTYEFDLWSGDNMEVADGTYFWTVDLPGKKAVATPLTRIALVGSFAAGDDWGDGVEMAFDATTRTYSATVEFKAGSEFKFKFNNNWDYNLGSGDKGLVFNGDNIKVAEAGKYKVTLDIANTAKYVLTK